MAPTSPNGWDHPLALIATDAICGHCAPVGGPRKRRRADVLAAPDIGKRFITPRRWGTRRSSLRPSAAKAIKRRDLVGGTFPSSTTVYCIDRDVSWVHRSGLESRVVGKTTRTVRRNNPILTRVNEGSNAPRRAGTPVLGP